MKLGVLGDNLLPEPGPSFGQATEPGLYGSLARYCLRPPRRPDSDATESVSVGLDMQPCALGKEQALDPAASLPVTQIPNTIRCPELTASFALDPFVWPSIQAGASAAHFSGKKAEAVSGFPTGRG